MKRLFAAVLLAGACASPAQAGIRGVWAVGDGDKVKRDAAAPAPGDVNAVWHEGAAHVFGARNEIIAFQVIVQADATGIGHLKARLSGLTSQSGERIPYRAPDADPTLSADRPIQIFLEHYMHVTKPTRASWVWEPGSPAAPEDQLGWAAGRLTMQMPG